MINAFEEKNSIFLVISDARSLLSKLVCDFLRSRELEVETLSLDENFLQNYQAQIPIYAQKDIYKIILIAQPADFSSKISTPLFAFLEAQNQVRVLKIPLILLASFSTPLEIMGDFSQPYYSFLEKQQNFINLFLKKFKQSMVFLARDLLLAQQTNISYPLRLFFLLIEQKYLLIPSANFYFQDERSFFKLIAEQLIRPHQNKRFLIQGKKTAAFKTANHLGYLYEQYFQKKLNTLGLIVHEQNDSFLQEFSLVKNSKVEIKSILDQKVRNHAELKPELKQELNSALVLKQIFAQKGSVSTNFQTKSIHSQPSQSTLKKVITNWTAQLSKSAAKQVTEEPETQNLNAELSKQIEHLFSTQRQKTKLTRQEANLSQGVKIIKKTKKRKIVFYFGSLIFGLSFMILSSNLLFQLNQNTLKKQLFQVVAGEKNKIEKIDKSINYHLFTQQLKLYQKILTADNLSEANDLAKQAALLITLGAQQIKIKELSYKLYQASLTGVGELGPLYENLFEELKKLVEQEKQYNAYLSDLNLELYPEKEKTIWKQSIEETRSSLKNISQLTNFLSVLSQLLLATDRSNVLLLIQDSNELRATGGFLSEAILLGFNRAKLVDQQIFDINELGERTYGNISANQEIQDLLGEKKLFLHDSNWTADFTKSSQDILWFVEQATGSKIDLILALNTKTIQQLIAVLGKLELSDGDEINWENYSKKIIEDTSSDNTKSKSWQIANLLLERINNLSPEELIIFNQVLLKDLAQKEAFLYSSQKSLQEIIEFNTWAGKTQAPACPIEFKQAPCLLDSIFQVALNVGFNKVNSQIEEKIEHSIGIGQKFIRHKRKISIKNSSFEERWPLGTYKAYYKFYLPKSALVEKIEFAKNILNAAEIKIEESETNRVVSLLVEIPPKSQKDLIITYLIPNDSEAAFSYVFSDQKQAGIYQKTIDYKIVFDEQFKPRLIAPQATYQNKIIYFQNLNLDNFLFAVNFDQ